MGPGVWANDTAAKKVRIVGLVGDLARLLGEERAGVFHDTIHAAGFLENELEAPLRGRRHVSSPAR